MKLATYKDGSRDGQLVVVARDLTAAHYATGIASRMQQALDDWNFIAPQLQDLYEALSGGKARHAFPFDAAHCMAPLPRAYQRLSGTPTSGAPHQRPSDALLGAGSPISGAASAQTLNFCPSLAAITGDVPPGATPEQGQDAIRLLTLAAGIHLSAPEEEEEESAAAFGPVAVTPDELGAAWQDTRVHLALGVAVNARQLAPIEAGQMRWPFSHLIMQAARLRPLTAGSIIGSGPLPGPQLPSLQRGDVVRIEMKDAAGQSIFGAIEQTVQG